MNSIYDTANTIGN